jgi:hypothetical protein
MTRSMFDPTGRETERSGSTFSPEDAENRSKLPPDVVDGEVSEAEARDAAAAADAAARGLSPAERIAAIPRTDPDADSANADAGSPAPPESAG